VGVSAYSQLQKLKGQEFDATDSDKAKKNVCVCVYLMLGNIPIISINAIIRYDITGVIMIFIYLPDICLAKLLLVGTTI